MDQFEKVKSSSFVEKEDCVEYTTLSGDKKKFYIGDCLTSTVVENGKPTKKMRITLIEI